MVLQCFIQLLILSYKKEVCMFGLGTTEIILVVLVLVLLFGAKKIPELMKGLGSGIKEFKKASVNDEDEEKKELKDSNKPIN